MIEIGNPDEWITKLEEEGISADFRERWLRFALTTSNFDKKKGILKEVVDFAVENYNRD